MSSSSAVPRLSNPSIKSIIATSRFLSEKDDSNKKDQETSNVKESFDKSKKKMISIIISHIDDLAKLVFVEPLSKPSYKTLLDNKKIQESMMKSEKFQSIAQSIIKNGQHNTIGRLSEYIDHCVTDFPNEIRKCFPFIKNLLKFCNDSYQSTVYMFAHLLNANIFCEEPTFWKEFLVNEKFFVLNKIDIESYIYRSPSLLHYAIQNPTTCNNWKFIVKLANFPENIQDLGCLLNKSAQIIEPSSEDEYKEIQVHAIEFLTKMIEHNSIEELSFNHEVVIKSIIEVMKSFKHHNFALNACANFIITCINSDNMREEIIALAYPFLIDTIKKNDIKERFLIAFCKYVINRINQIDDCFTECIPESILRQCDGWCAKFKPNLNLSK